MIFDSLPTKRLKQWVEFRNQLEVSADPLSDVARLYSEAPKVKVYSDPYDKSTWPTPWELIEENEYCPFNQVLGVAYSLGLTERFKDWQPKIAIAVDTSNMCVYYLLYYNDMVYGFEDDVWTSVKNLPKSLSIKRIYNLDSLH